jgi:hypothetical protein
VAAKLNDDSPNGFELALIWGRLAFLSRLYLRSIALPLVHFKSALFPHTCATEQFFFSPLFHISLYMACIEHNAKQESSLD